MTLPVEASLNILRERLQRREAELRSAVLDAKAAAAERASAQGPQVEDPAEEGEQRNRGGVEHAEMQRHLRELVDIEQARQRIADGGYGECADCGRHIVVERLLAQPTATRCVACQNAHEATHPPLRFA